MATIIATARSEIKAKAHPSGAIPSVKAVNAIPVNKFLDLKCHFPLIRGRYASAPRGKALQGAQFFAFWE